MTKANMMVTVVWRHETKRPVPLAEQIADLAARLPESVTQSIADFTRFHYARTVPFRSAEWIDEPPAPEAAQTNRELVAAD